jgi:hypothetical protein
MDQIERVTVTSDRLQIRITGTPDEPGRDIKLKWLPKTKDAATKVGGDGSSDIVQSESPIQSIVRAHSWLRGLRDGAHESIEGLAAANGLHPKVIAKISGLLSFRPT